MWPEAACLRYALSSPFTRIVAGIPVLRTRSICLVSCVTVSGSGAVVLHAGCDACGAGGVASRAGRRRVTLAWKSKKPAGDGFGVLDDIVREYNPEFWRRLSSPHKDSLCGLESLHHNHSMQIRPVQP